MRGTIREERVRAMKDLVNMVSTLIETGDVKHLALKGKRY